MKGRLSPVARRMLMKSASWSSDCQEGQTITEYALVLSLVGVVLISFAVQFRDQVPAIIDGLIDVLVFRLPKGIIGAFTYF